MKAVTDEAEMRLPNSSNAREHWSVRAKRVKVQRQRACWMALGLKLQHAKLPLSVRLTRVWAPPQRALDDDGVVSSLKGVRDGVADAIGVDDRDPRVLWRYRQEPGATSAVRIEARPVSRSARKTQKALPRAARRACFASRLSSATVRP